MASENMKEVPSSASIYMESEDSTPSVQSLKISPTSEVIEANASKEDYQKLFTAKELSSITSAETTPRQFKNTNMRFTSSNTNLIFVPHGIIKLFNRQHLRSQSPTTEFYLFPNLPGEIRNKIYTLASLFPLQISAISLSKPISNGPGRYRISNQLLFGDLSARYNLMLAIKEADLFLRKKIDFEIMFETEDKNKKGVLIDKQRDIVYLDLEFGFMGNISFKLPEFLKMPTGVQLIKHLTVTLPFIPAKLAFLSEAINSMKGLETLNFKIGCIETRAPKNFVVPLLFEDFSGHRMEFIVSNEFFGEKLLGVGGLGELFKFFRWQEDEQAVINLWMAFNRLLRDCTMFPQKVGVIICFRSMWDSRGMDAVGAIKAISF